MNHTHTLKALMQRANIASYRALATQATVSRWQVQQLRAGNIDQMRLGVLVHLAEVLKISVSDLLQAFGVQGEVVQDAGVAEDNTPEVGVSAGGASAGGQSLSKAAEEGSQSEQLVSLKQEYQRLQGQVAQQVAEGRSQLQSEALQTLETWLIQWPTIAQRAKDNETLAAVKILPFVKPVEQLMVVWGVEAIAPVDDQVPYDPQRHQLMGGIAEPGTMVQVTHSGVQQQGRLIHRAKVKLLTQAPGLVP